MTNINKKICLEYVEYFFRFLSRVLLYSNVIINFLSNIYISFRYRKRIREQLAQLIQTNSKPSIFFLPTHTWFSTAFQRPQQMARALSEVGCTVIYYEPWENSQIVINKKERKERCFIGVRKLAPKLYLIRCPENLLLGILSVCEPDAFLMLWPEQTKYIPERTSSIIVYENIDSHDLITYATEDWNNLHLKWVKKANIVVATADDLFCMLRNIRPDTLLLPNGVRIEDWVSTKSCLPPRDMIEASYSSVVVGYYGSIAEWFDWKMWKYAAKAKQDWSFVIIGLPYDGNFEKIMEHIKCFPNIYYLGPKSYKSLPSYLTYFDVATIPFVVNRITNACSPIKLFEYMAAGKPIVATPMREILKYKSVLIAETPEAFVKNLEKALSIKDDLKYQLILKQEAEANTWCSRAEVLRSKIEKVGRKRI